MRKHGGCARKRRPRFDVADIFAAHGGPYAAGHALTDQQRKVMRRIQVCRTSKLGGNARLCLDCGQKEISYNSCRDRHCPKCQALDQARWLARRQERILPAPYFHVVFTLPAELRPLALRNRKHIYNLLFAAASETLLELGGDPKRLGAQPGVTAVLHTWRRDLLFHPHLHCVVTAGGLALNGKQWIASSRKHLFPVKVMGKLFRGKFMAGLEALRRQGALTRDPEADPRDFEDMCIRLYRKNWVVYAKAPFAGPKQVFSYLGRYTHRVAISNHRIRSVTDNEVVIDTRGGKTAAMPPQEFIRRFLLHVLPLRFVKIRHYGLCASANVNTKLRAAKELLEESGNEQEKKPDNGGRKQTTGKDFAADWRELLNKLTGVDLGICSACGSARVQMALIPPTSLFGSARSRAPPWACVTA